MPRPSAPFGRPSRHGPTDIPVSTTRWPAHCSGSASRTPPFRRSAAPAGTPGRPGRIGALHDSDRIARGPWPRRSTRQVSATAPWSNISGSRAPGVRATPLSRPGRPGPPNAPASCTSCCSPPRPPPTHRRTRSRNGALEPWNPVHHQIPPACGPRDTASAYTNGGAGAGKRKTAPEQQLWGG